MFRISLIISVLILTSCQSNPCPSTSDAYMQDYRQLLSEVSDLDRYISTKQWAPYDERMQHLLLDCYPEVASQLSDSLSKTIWLDAIGFAMVRHRFDVQKIIQDSTDQTLIEIRKHMRELWDNPYSAFEEIFRRQTGEEFQEVLKDVKSEQDSQQ